MPYILYIVDQRQEELWATNTVILWLGKLFLPSRDMRPFVCKYFSTIQFIYLVICKVYYFYVLIYVLDFFFLFWRKIKHSIS